MGVLLERHRAGMYAVALRLLGYSPEAQDAVQDAMLIALQRLDGLREPSAAGAWLHAVVRNACRMRLRARRSVRLDDGTLAVLPTAEPSPDRLLDQHGLRDWIWQALESLSEPLQLVVLLRYFSGITSYDQIAGLCGIPIGTVRSRLHQARVQLSAALLETASDAYDDAAALHEGRRRDVAELYTAIDRDDAGAALAAFCAPDLVLVLPRGSRERGPTSLARVIESDRAAGVYQRPVQVTASRRYTIIEAQLRNPPWDPHHCPPGVIWLMLMRDNHIQQIRLFHPAASPVPAPS
jgi:RNA polymerase sigma-70 factor (ECF subfamily)